MQAGSRPDEGQRRVRGSAASAVRKGSAATVALSTAHSSESMPKKSHSAKKSVSRLTMRALHTPRSLPLLPAASRSSFKVSAPCQGTHLPRLWGSPRNVS